MIRAEDFVDRALAHGLSLWSGVPCSYLKPLINRVIADPALRYVPAANEGDAVAIASGAHVAGARGVAMMQNSGLGNAINPLTSLCAVCEIPVLLIVTLRGDPAGALDEPQHALMGAVTTRMLELVGIEHAPFPRDDASIEPALAHAVARMDASRKPFALVMRDGSVAAHPLDARVSARAPSGAEPVPIEWPVSSDRPARAELLRAVRSSAGPRDVLVATTGYTGRELYALGDDPASFYMVGAMGCASSFGLGVALAAPSRRVIVLDGDGAALMRLGALATLGHERPSNLLHVLLDNESHESTGGQSTASASIDFTRIASACGYPRVVRCASAAALAALVAAPQDALTFAHCKTKPGVMPGLPRPSVPPHEVARRFGEHLGDGEPRAGSR